MNRSRLSHIISYLKTDQNFNSVQEFEFNKTKIVAVVKSLDNIRITRAPKISADAVKKWNDYLKNGDIEFLTRKDIKQLSWHSDIALTNYFLDSVEKKKIKISKSISKGLVYCLLDKWKTLSDLSLKLRIKDSITRDNPSYFSQVEKYIFKNDGAMHFSEEIFKDEITILEHITDRIGITTSTNQYCENVYDYLIKNNYKTLLSSNSKKRRWFFDNVLSALTKDQILNCIELVVSENDVPDEESKEDLKQFVLFHPHFGDPRLPGFEGNWPKNHKVTNLFIEWLSQSDIKFFFELFIDNKNDIQGRRNFWLRYAHLVKGTRVIVSSNDQDRFARQITEMQQKNNNSSLFATLKEKTKEATGFMMDFGIVIIVEFSKANNACYVYDKTTSRFAYTSRELFWRTHEFSEASLKNRSAARECLTHRDGWEESFANKFALYGLRAKSNERWGNR